MFDTRNAGVGLLAGETDEYDPLFDDGFDDLVYRLTREAFAQDSPVTNRHQLPIGFDLIPPGPLLSMALTRVDRSKLNGHDLVRTMVAQERQVSHHQAGSMADAVEISYSAPGNAESPAERIEEAAEFTSDEIRAALTMTRRAAESRLSEASDLVERLPRVWEMLDQGLIDWPRARVIIHGTEHLPESNARTIVDEIAGRAPRLTTGQLRAWIRKLCIQTDPEESKKRYEHAIEQRLLWIEQTVDGTGNVHLLDIPIDQAKAIGRRVNGYMISLKKDGDNRTHDQMRADIAIDMLLGSDPTLGGRGLVDIRVDLTTLAGLDDKAAEITGLGPVIADVARKVADRQQKAEWRVVVTDDDGHVIDIVTTARRPTSALTRYIEATQPTCSFVGCQMPAKDCDFDHLLPWRDGGETSSCNGGPKCRHDHILKDHGWLHKLFDGQDIWTSPMGHTYITAGQSP
ncbi:MAG: DUF222 domain-containing protein [Acidimicrobiia bacterium]